MMIGITGGTGFIGKALTQFFIDKGDEVFLFTRSTDRKSQSPYIHYVSWDPAHHHVTTHLPDFDVLINLAGATINKRWTTSYKEAIIKSRLDAAQTVEILLKQQKKQLPLLINASAIGYYGTSLNRVFTEADRVDPTDFLSEVTTRWEASVEALEPLCGRVVPIRFGVVLGKEEGAFPKMVLPYRFFVGGRVGSGKQWVSWIHIHDLVRLIQFVSENPEMKGPVNATAPNPVQMNEFGKTVATVMERPHLFPVPSFALRLLLGGMSDLLLKGQKVLPDKLLEHGFSFKFPTLEQAVKALTLSRHNE